MIEGLVFIGILLVLVLAIIIWGQMNVETTKAYSITGLNAEELDALIEGLHAAGFDSIHDLSNGQKSLIQRMYTEVLHSAQTST